MFKDNKSTLTLAQSHRLLQKIQRAPTLNLYQRNILSAIYSRTEGWRKRYERITLDHLEKGVYDWDDATCYLPPVGFSRKTIQRAIMDLLDLKVIGRKKDKASSSATWIYCLNITNIMGLPKRLQPKAESSTPFDSVLEDEGFTEALQRTDFKALFEEEEEKTEKSVSQETEVGQQETEPVSRRPSGSFQTAYKEDKIKDTKNKDTKSTDCSDKPSTVMEGEASIQTQPKTRSLEDAVAAMDGVTGKVKPPGAAAFRSQLEECWRSSWEEACPSVPFQALIGKDLDMLVGVSKTFASQAEFLNYFGWVVRHWNFLRNTCLGWMSDGGPPNPSLRCIVSRKIRPKLVSAWSQRVELENQMNLSASERGIQQLIRSKGLSYAAAKAEWERHDTVAQAQREVQATRERLTIKEAGMDQRKTVLEHAFARRASSGLIPPPPGGYRRPQTIHHAPVDLSDLSADLPTWEEAGK